MVQLTPLQKHKAWKHIHGILAMFLSLFLSSLGSANDCVTIHKCQKPLLHVPLNIFHGIQWMRQKENINATDTPSAGSPFAVSHDLGSCIQPWCGFARTLWTSKWGTRFNPSLLPNPSSIPKWEHLPLYSKAVLGHTPAHSHHCLFFASLISN